MALPLSGTNIQLLANIPWRNDYKHTRYFTSVSEQTAWFDGRTVVHAMQQANYQRIEGRYLVKVNRHIDDLWQVNYLRFRNSQYNNKWFYCFVTKMEYENKMMTKVYFEVDVFQSWFLNTTFQPSYVMREHQKRWNADGTPVINTVDEGLDYGSEYDVKALESVRPSNGLQWLVIVTKSLMHGKDAKKITPVLNGTVQPLSFYVHPFKVDGTVPESNLTLSPINTVLKGLYSHDDAVNNVVSLFITEYFGMDLVGTTGQTVNFPDSKFQGVTVADDQNENFSTVYVKDFPFYYAKMIEHADDKYVHFDKPTESKLLMFPYVSLELTDFQGGSESYKLEYLDEKGITLAVMGSMGTSNKVAYSLPLYNGGNLPNVVEQTKTSLQTALISDSPNDVPILNDYLSAFLQGNRNSLNVQRRSIEFNGAMQAITSAPATANPIAGGAEFLSGIGNTVLQLEGLQAKKADIANKPAAIGKMGSNTYFEQGNTYKGLHLIYKQIKPEYRRKLEYFFHMYGYKLNEVKVPNLRTRQHFNHIQTVSCVLKGTLPQEEHVRLEKVFNDGITLWHTDDIGNYNLTNNER